MHKKTCHVSGLEIRLLQNQAELKAELVQSQAELKAELKAELLQNQNSLRNQMEDLIGKTNERYVRERLVRKYGEKFSSYLDWFD